MRHKVVGRKLGRTTSHRKALYRNLVTDLLGYEKIITTSYFMPHVVYTLYGLLPLSFRRLTVTRLCPALSHASSLLTYLSCG